MSSLVKINCDAHGLGDLMITMWISEGSKGHTPQLIHHGTGARATVLAMFDQVNDPSSENGIYTYLAYEDELKCKGSRPRVNMRGESVGIWTAPKRPVCSTSSDRLRITGLHFDKERHSILLFPETAYVSRQWPVAYWVDLCWSLHNVGYQVKLMMQDDQEKYKNTPSWYYGLGIEDVVGFMSHASVVVGNDSGPVHLAGTLGVQSIALLGATNANVFSHMPEVHTLTSKKDCTGCYFGKPFRAACDQGCASLFELPPSLVLEKIIQMTDGPFRK